MPFAANLSGVPSYTFEMFPDFIVTGRGAIVTVAQFV